MAAPSPTRTATAPVTVRGTASAWLRSGTKITWDSTLTATYLPAAAASTVTRDWGMSVEVSPKNETPVYGMPSGPSPDQFPGLSGGGTGGCARTYPMTPSTVPGTMNHRTESAIRYAGTDEPSSR